MRRLIAALVLLAVAAFGVSGCSATLRFPWAKAPTTIAHQTTSTVTSAGATTSPAPPSVAAQGQSACTDLNGTVGSDQICHVHAATATYKIDMTFPLDYPDMQAVTDFLKKDRDSFLDWVAEIGPSQPRGRPYLYDVTAETYRSGTPESGTHSLVLHIDNDTGLAHKATRTPPSGRSTSTSASAPRSISTRCSSLGQNRWRCSTRSSGANWMRRLLISMRRSIKTSR